MELLVAVIIFLTPLTLAAVLMSRSDRRERERLMLARIAKPAEPEVGEIAITRDVPDASSGLAGYLLTKTRLLLRLQQITQQSGLRISASDLLGLMVLLAAVGGAIGGLLSGGSLWPSLIPALFCGLMPLVYILMRRRRRLAAFDQQLPDILEMLKSSLDAGHTLQRALQAVAGEFVEPAASELKIVMEQNVLGVPLAQALEFMFERVPDDNLRFLVVAVRIQSEAGTSLAGIMGQLAETIRDRQRVEMKVRVLTAQPKLTGLIAGLMPVLLILGLRLLNPEHVRMLFYDPTGIILTKIAVALELAALLMIGRMLRVDY